MTLVHSPLAARHRDLGAKTAEFGGWEMPLEYAGGGVLAEHRAVREAVGLFDVSHLGYLRVAGQGAAGLVDSTLTNDLGRIGPGQAQYTLCCAEDGGVVDDLIVYLVSDTDLVLVPNAANAGEVARLLAEAAPAGVVVTDEHQQQATLAVQGPRSAEVLNALGLPTTHDYMAFDAGAVGDAPVVVCRSGYTGELGFELLVPADHAEHVWDALVRAGEPHGLRACGLGARDTLRTEMGYPLHGQDLSAEISPVMARSGWAVGWDKPAFWGREALLRQREGRAVPLLRGLRARGRGIPRAGMTAVTDGPDGTDVGRVTSGTFSPTLRTGIGLALLERSIGFGDVVSVDVRGRRETFDVVKPPFVEASTR